MDVHLPPLAPLLMAEPAGGAAGVPPPSPATSPLPGPPGAPETRRRRPSLEGRRAARQLAAELQVGLMPLLDPGRAGGGALQGRLSPLPYANDECVHVFRVRCRSSSRTRSLVRWLRHTRHVQENLMRAVRSDNAERVASLVRLGADVNAPDETGRTALHVAAQQRSLDMVSLLLELGARPDALDATGSTALHAAARAGAGAVVRRLLASGASVTVSDSGGQTAGQKAAERLQLFAGLCSGDGWPYGHRHLAELREVHELLETAQVSAGRRGELGGVLRQIEGLTIGGQSTQQLGDRLRQMTLGPGGGEANSSLAPARQVAPDGAE